MLYSIVYGILKNLIVNTIGSLKNLIVNTNSYYLRRCIAKKAESNTISNNFRRIVSIFTKLVSQQQFHKHTQLRSNDQLRPAARIVRASCSCSAATRSSHSSPRLSFVTPAAINSRGWTQLVILFENNKLEVAGRHLQGFTQLTYNIHQLQKHQKMY